MKRVMLVLFLILISCVGVSATPVGLQVNIEGIGEAKDAQWNTWNPWAGGSIPDVCSSECAGKMNIEDDRISLLNKITVTSGTLYGVMISTEGFGGYELDYTDPNFYAAVQAPEYVFYARNQEATEGPYYFSISYKPNWEGGTLYAAESFCGICPPGIVCKEEYPIPEFTTYGLILAILIIGYFVYTKKIKGSKK